MGSKSDVLDVNGGLALASYVTELRNYGGKFFELVERRCGKMLK